MHSRCFAFFRARWRNFCHLRYPEKNGKYLVTFLCGRLSDSPALVTGGSVGDFKGSDDFRIQHGHPQRRHGLPRQTEAREIDHIVHTAIFVRGRCLDRHDSSYAQEAADPRFSEEHVHQLLTRQHKFVLSCIREGKIESLLQMGTSAVALSGDSLSENSFQAKTSCEDALAAAEPPPQPPTAKIALMPEPPPAVNDSAPGDNILDLALPENTPPAEPEPEPEPISLDPGLRLEWLARQSVCKAGSVLMRYRLADGPVPMKAPSLLRVWNSAASPSPILAPSPTTKAKPRSPSASVNMLRTPIN